MPSFIDNLITAFGPLSQAPSSTGRHRARLASSRSEKRSSSASQRSRGDRLDGDYGFAGSRRSEPKGRDLSYHRRTDSGFGGSPRASFVYGTSRSPFEQHLRTGDAGSDHRREHHGPPATSHRPTASARSRSRSDAATRRPSTSEGADMLALMIRRRDSIGGGEALLRASRPELGADWALVRQQQQQHRRSHDRQSDRSGRDRIADGRYPRSERSAGASTRALSRAARELGDGGYGVGARARHDDRTRSAGVPRQGSSLRGDYVGTGRSGRYR